MERNLVTMAPYVAEFSGTFMLAVCFEQWFAAQSGDDFHPMAYTAYASLYMALIYTLEPVSGAHFNPAVTLCTWLTGRNKELKNVLTYWVCQFGAGIIANLLCGVLGAGRAGPDKGDIYDHNLTISSLCEVIYCGLLCFVVLNVACSYENMGNYYYGIAIGFAVLAGGYASCAEASPAFNPAVSFGVYIATGQPIGILHGIRCICCNFVGAALAAVLYWAIRPKEFDREEAAESVFPKCMAEFVGTFLLTMTVLLAVVTKPAFAAWAAMACLVSLTYALNTVSGSHFNPSLSLGVMLSGRDKLARVDCVTYIALQISAGALAGLVIGITAHIGGIDMKDVQMAVAGKSKTVLDFRPEIKNAMVAEVIFTAALVFVFLASTTTRLIRSTFHFGVVSAGALAPAVVTIGTASGSALNPAIAMGLAATEFLFHPMGIHPGKWFCWVLAQTIGGCIGSLGFRFLYWREFEERIIPLVSENEGGAEVGSLVGGNENADRWVGWQGERPGQYAYRNKERSCTGCRSM